MNEHEEPKLTSRRARRMQEQLETTGISVVSQSAAPSEEVAAESAAALAADSDAIEISPVDENGRVRTRRELRELRDAAIARQAEVESPQPEAAPESESAVDTVVDEIADAAASEPVEEVPAELEAVSESSTEEEPAADAEAAPSTEEDGFVVAQVEVPKFDDRLAPTEAMSFADLIEVANDSAEAASDAVADESDAEDEASPEAEPDAEDSQASPAKGRFRMPWSRSKDAATEPGAAVDVESVDVESAEQPHDEILEIDGDEDVPEIEVVEAEPDAAPELVTAVEEVEDEAPAAPVAIEDEDEDDEDGEVADAPAPASARTSYSFPDIAPLAEERSVFDDPATQAIPALPSDELIAPLTERTGDFDDLISRAIAAEGATSSNTAALILPSMPEGTDLAGPLGETGELFVTGSIELPKSLGETGGHARLHDSIESDPLADLGIDLSDEPVPDDSAPVSATRAISARTVEGSGVVAPHTKKGNRLPLILSVTAGGLLLAVIGLLAWGASNGMFG